MRPLPTPRDARTAEWNLSPAAMAVIVAAIASVPAIIALLKLAVPHSPDSSAATAFRDSRALVPHLLAVALIVAGFRLTGEVVAVLTGIATLVYAGLLALLSLEPAAIFLAAMQVVIIVGSLFDQTSSDGDSATTPGAMVGGLAIALTIWGLGFRSLRASNVAEQTRRAVVASQAAPTVPWTTRSNLADLVALASCVERFRGDSGTGEYPASLDTLQRWAALPMSDRGDCTRTFSWAYSAPGRPLGAAEAHDRVWYTPPRGPVDRWRSGGFILELEAVWDSSDGPVPLDAPGTRSYLIDGAGAVHVTAERRRAMTTDDTLPHCATRGAGERGECVPDVPRQRWGVTPALPEVGLMMRDDSVPVGARVSVIFYYVPVSPSDSIASWGVSWDAGAPVQMKKVSAREAYQRGATRLTAELSHVYARPGAHEVRATVLTRGGDRLEHRGTIEVLPRR